MPVDSNVESNANSNADSKNEFTIEESQTKPDKEQKPGYYDVPMLKAPVWKWEIASYFFLGGLSAGAYVLSRLAERYGDEKHEEITRTGTFIAALAALPCAPLLIADLGDPKRFHHMLRIWKPQSPMNVGSWTLTGYSSVLAIATLREILRSQEAANLLNGAVAIHENTFVDESIETIADSAGIPLAILLAGYTGVLLSGTANPVWSKNTWLGALFSASAMGAGTAAISLALEAKGINEESREVLEKIDAAARVAEAATLTGYIHSLGDLAEPLTGGKQSKIFWGGTVAAGLVLPTILDRLPIGGKARRWIKIIAAILTLIGGLSTRWSVLFAGHDAANDPEAARQASRKK